MIPDTLLQALSLDLSVLEALLHQHRCNHGRAKYFSRMSMTLRSIQRYNFSAIPSQLVTLEKEVNTHSQQRNRKKRRNEEEEWDLKKNTKKDPVLVQIEEQVSKLQQTLCDHLPQALSRIQHASAALFKEVSRGFFLPFCTVALAALARIRMLLRRLGRLALMDLHQLQGTISEIFGNSSILLTSDQMDQGISMYMEPSSGQPDFTIQNDATRTQTLASLGLTNVQFFKSERHTDQDQANKAEASNAIVDESASNFGSNTATMKDNDDDDLGESMEDNRTALEADDIIEQVGPAAADDSQSNLHPSDPMDRNMAIVANIKNKTKKQDRKTPKDSKKSKKDSKKRKETERAQPPAGDKKKKKKSKGDFFDSLFD